MFKAYLVICFISNSMCILIEDHEGPHANPTKCEERLFELKVELNKYFKFYNVVEEKCILTRVAT